MERTIPPRFLKVLVFLLIQFTFTAHAQNRQQYTGSNIIKIGFETPDGIIEFTSDHLQILYNEATRKLECRLSVNTLYTLNDTIPSDLAYEVLFGSKYPDFILIIDAPAEILNTSRINSEPQPRSTTIELQGTRNESRFPVAFASDNGVINLSTTFDIRMGHFRATIPAVYKPMLTGRLLITIRNARWLNNGE